MIHNRKFRLFQFVFVFVIFLQVSQSRFQNDPGANVSEESGTMREGRDFRDEILTSFFANLRSMLHGEWGGRGYCNKILEFGDWPICGDGLQPYGTPIYSFGIADDYDFEAAAGLYGFQVHAFDPTRNYPQDLAKNVNFLNCGLRGEVSRNWSHSSYGDAVGMLLSLPQILKYTNLNQSQKFILKLDCEGCEWEALSMLKKYPNIFDRILQINIEMHFTSSLRVDSTNVLEYMKDTYDLLLQYNFIPWFIFPQGGSRADRNHIEKVLKNGFPENICCYEVGFLRNPVAAITRKDIVSPRRELKRPESVWKWGQVWGNTGIEYIRHSELSKGGRGLSVIKSIPLRQNSGERREKACFPFPKKL